MFSRLSQSSKFFEPRKLQDTRNLEYSWSFEVQSQNSYNPKISVSDTMNLESLYQAPVQEFR